MAIDLLLCSQKCFTGRAYYRAEFMLSDRDGYFCDQACSPLFQANIPADCLGHAKGDFTGENLLALIVRNGKGVWLHRYAPSSLPAASAIMLALCQPENVLSMAMCVTFPLRFMREMWT